MGGPASASRTTPDRTGPLVLSSRSRCGFALRSRRGPRGYGRAARLIDRMEEEGIIGADRGAGKPREVLVEEG
ncbi:MAG: hypothetical protein IPL96_01495 [Holophagaceae bacterium]|nr:hypothetical protein [Holophagaceae bacterium]